MKKIQTITATLFLAFLSGCHGMPEQTKEATIPPLENTSEPTTTIEPITADKEPIMPLFTDEEAFELGDTCARSMQRLFLDYLYFEEGYLKLKPTGNQKYSTYDAEGYSDGEFLCFEMESNTIQTFDELKAFFNEFCTEEYTIKLLRGASVFYKDIDGKIYMFPTENCFMGFKDAYLTGWEQRGENEIVFTLTDISDDLLGVDPPEYYSEDYVRDTSYDRPFTMTVVKRNGKWLISDCDDPASIGYVYRSDTFGEHDEYADEEARRLADEIALKIKEAFLNYCQYDREKLVLKPNGKEVTWKDDYLERTYTAIGVESDMIKTLEDLESALAESFTPQGILYLWEYPDNFHKYMDIDGALYMIPSKESYTDSYKNVRFIDWRRWGNKLIFTYYAEGGNPDTDPADRYINFSVANRDGKWLIDSCDRPDVFGYCYESPKPKFNEIPIEHEEYLGNYDENEFAVSSEKAMSDLIDALVTSEKWREEFKLNYSGMAVLEQEAYYQITLSTENEFSYSNIGVFWVNADSGAIYLKFDPTLDAEGYFSELSGDIPKEDSRTRLIAFP